MFLWLWLIGWSAFALPLAIASLRGWAPKRVRSRTSPWGLRVRGVALLVIWIGGLTGPLLRWSHLDSQDATFFASVVQGGFLVFAGGLVAGSQLSEWFYRRALRAQTVDQAQGISGRP
ncbi:MULTISPECIES: hypothetical protein [Streptomyces]|uniref:hypothetical protein n=1 Tax=Streptomyces TaxID=1883 RepID=UPI000765C384|nr:hypothetical protein [Streptomyces europaeiscabiei]MDX2757160.1 hypothetical protein [Streptomyces europaeiscabiei]MDX2766828.1 hypothetical protein [Streptomyces europaeiscabiei]MDX3781314.1 hypothetical protein [Streptomyces europaeiscabiei]MDX3834958.1 hypothetical protein [Streptomyces europaeiscabiei]MDX3843645.1 hypothetical protein [Streptomyces europaeiscabiei]